MALRILSLVALLIGTNPHANAAGIPTPTTLEGGGIISVEQAQRLAAVGGVLFVDVRNPVNYGRGHVPGARLIAYRGPSENRADFDPSQDRFDMGLLPTDRGAKIIFYSHGDTGWKSYKAAVTAIAAGYRNVHWMRNGFAGWKAQGYAVE